MRSDRFLSPERRSPRKAISYLLLDLPAGIPGMVMTTHTFGEYLDFHPHLHAIVADGLFSEDGSFRVAPPRFRSPQKLRIAYLTFPCVRRKTSALCGGGGGGYQIRQISQPREMVAMKSNVLSVSVL
jgi:hypothetical protein